MVEHVLRDYLGVRKTLGDLGVEIEVEGDDLPRNELGYWRQEKDGSLRGESAEFVLRKPLTKEALVKALSELDEAYKEYGSKVHDSIRAGVHVHVNVQELTKLQLFNFVTVYLLLEDLLVKWCGESRQGNLFCLRCRDAEAWLQLLENAIQFDTLDILKNDHIRYASINLKALCQYGSLEFRSMRGTRDLELIKTWAFMLHDLRDYSMLYENPLAVIEKFTQDKDLFVREALGEHYKTFTYEGYESLLEPCLRFANDLAHFSSWKERVSRLIGGLEFKQEIDFPDEPEVDF